MAEPEQNGERRTGLKEFAQAEAMVQLAIILPAATVMGWLLGAGVDRWLHTDWVYVLGILLGAVAGFVNIYRMAVKYLNKA
jgi:F0F1-type ATP synthase assembly protein I